jgi:translocation and assembly module TamA
VLRPAVVPLVCACVFTLPAGCAHQEPAEGRPWVHAVKLAGVKAVKAGALKKKLAVRATSRIPLSPKRYLEPFAAESDEERIEAFYRAQGYFSAEVTDVTVKKREDGESVDVLFSVDEGLPTKIREVRLDGIGELHESVRRKLERLRLKRGQVFVHDEYLEQKDQLLGVLKAHGHPFPEVEGEVRVDRDRRTADITLRVAPGPWARFGEVRVEGTVRTDPRVVRRLSGLRPGTVFDLEEVELARRRLYDFGAFALVKPRYELGGDGRVIVTVEVREAGFNQLRLGGGFGLEPLRNEVRAQVNYTRYNFLGGLRRLELTLRPAYAVIPAVWDPIRHGPALTAEATLTQPRPGWLSQLRWTVGYDLGIEYATQFHGPRTSIGANKRLWRDRILLDLSYHFQLLDFFNTDPAVLADPAQAGQLFGYTDPYRVAWLQPEVIFDLRDARLDARKGGYLGVSVEVGGPWTGSAFTYEKLRGDLRGYLPLGKWVVLAARVEFGQMFHQGDHGTPVTRRFYLGGPTSHRGFSYNRLSLQVPSGTPGVPPLPVGGDQLLLFQGEVRVNVAYLFGNWLSAAAFFDAGDVAAPACGAMQCPSLPAGASTSVDVTRLHYAVGGGLRYRTIIGTIRADVGVRLNRLDPTEPDGLPNPDPGERVVFHLSVGEAF